MANVKTMSVTELLQLRKDVDTALQSRRAELEAQLSQIEGKQHEKVAGRGLQGRKVAAKYRHPKTGEEWSGRGGVAKWLAAEIKSGKKKEAFLIKK